MRCLPVLLLLLLACSGERAPRPTGMTDSADTDTGVTISVSSEYTPESTRTTWTVTDSPRDLPQPSIAMARQSSVPRALAAAVAPTSRTDTVVTVNTVTKVDTAKLGDSLVTSTRQVTVTKRVTITTISTQQFTSVLWRKPVALGLPYGLWYQPPDSLCSPSGITATSMLAAPDMASGLARVRACKGRTTISLRRAKSLAISGSDTALSVAAMKREMDTWPWDAINQAVKDSTIIGMMLLDDPTLNVWDTRNTVIKGRVFDTLALVSRYARWDSAAAYAKSRAPGLAILARERPANMLKGGYRWQHVDAVTFQYNSPFRDLGDPSAVFKAAAELAGANGWRIILGNNELDGGCGPAEKQASRPVRATLP